MEVSEQRSSGVTDYVTCDRCRIEHRRAGLEMWRIVDSEFRGEGRVSECIDVRR